jgi:hypothetical protein
MASGEVGVMFKRLRTQIAMKFKHMKTICISSSHIRYSLF